MERLTINIVLLWEVKLGYCPNGSFCAKGRRQISRYRVANFRSLWLMGILDYQKQIMYRMPISFYYTQSMLAHINTCSGN